MKLQSFFLAVTIVNILLAIAIFFTLHLDIELSEVILPTLSGLFNISYLLLLLAIIWIVQKVDKNYKIIVSIVILIILNLLGFIIPTFPDNIKTILIITLPSFIATVYFIYQCFTVKTSFYSSEFKLIGYAYILRFICSVSYPWVLNYFELNIIPLNSIWSAIPTIAIAILIKKSYGIGQTDYNHLANPYLD